MPTRSTPRCAIASPPRSPMYTRASWPCGSSWSALSRSIAGRSTGGSRGAWSAPTRAPPWPTASSSSRSTRTRTARAPLPRPADSAATAPSSHARSRARLSCPAAMPGSPHPHRPSSQVHLLHRARARGRLLCTLQAEGRRAVALQSRQVQARRRHRGALLLPVVARAPQDHGRPQAAAAVGRAPGLPGQVRRRLGRPRGGGAASAGGPRRFHPGAVLRQHRGHSDRRAARPYQARLQEGRCGQEEGARAGGTVRGRGVSRCRHNSHIDGSRKNCHSRSKRAGQWKARGRAALMSM
eukprot:1231386-Prymnesium_polylepis.1